MEATKTNFGDNLRQYGIMIALVVVIVAFAIGTQGRLIMPDNLWNLIQQNAYVLILAMGMLMVIIAGHIDLSVGSVVAFIGAVVGWMMYTWNVPWVVAVLAGLLIGLLVGAWHGFWVAYVRIPAFVVTLAGMMIFRGLAQVIAARTMAGFPEGFNAIANGSIPNFLGFMNNPVSGAGAFSQSFDTVTVVIGILGVGGLVVSSMRSRRSQLQHGLPVGSVGAMVLRLVLMSAAILVVTFILAMNLIGGTPILLIIVGVLIFVYSFVTTRTVFGRHVYAIGGNRNAALLSGVNTARVDFGIFLNMGLLTAVAAIVTTSRAGAAVAAAGTGYELDAIASCFIGGAAVTGGVGRVSGAMVGALIMGVLNMGLSILNVDANWQMSIKGFVLLLAVTLDLVSKRRSSVG